MKENYSQFPWVQLPSWQNKADTLPPWECLRSGGPSPWRPLAPPRRARPCRASPWHQERFLQQRRFIDLRSLPVTGQSRPCTGSMLVWLDLLEVDRGCGPVQPKSELWKSHHSWLFLVTHNNIVFSENFWMDLFACMDVIIQFEKKKNFFQRKILKERFCLFFF